MNARLNKSKIVLAAAVFSVVLVGCDKRSATEPSGASGMGSGGTGAGGAGMASPGARGTPGSGESSSDSPAPLGKPAPAAVPGK